MQALSKRATALKLFIFLLKRVQQKSENYSFAYSEKLFTYSPFLEGIYVWDSKEESILIVSLLELPFKLYPVSLKSVNMAQYAIISSPWSEQIVYTETKT